MKKDNELNLRIRWAGVSAAMVWCLHLAACDNPQAPGVCGEIPEQTIVVGEAATVTACFEDPNGDVVNYHATTTDAGVATVSAAGSAVTVTGVSPGTSVVTVTATDVTQLTGSQQFRVVVPNRAPVAVGEISSREVQNGESGLEDVSAYFQEPDGQPLTYAMTVSDEGVLGISAAGSVVTFDARAKGSATVTAMATDPGGLSAVQSFLVTVPNRHPQPVGSMLAQTIEVDAATTTDVSGFFTDPDGDDLIYAATSSDAAVAVIAISGGDLTVMAIAKGEATVTVTATDTEGLAATQGFLVNVPNRAPFETGSIDGHTIEVSETAVLDLSGNFEDPDGDALVHSAATSDLAVAGVEVDGGVLTVAAIAKGAAIVTVTATDTEGLATTLEFAVTVPNRPPLVAGSIEGQTIEVGETATTALSGYFQDPDGDSLVYTVAVPDTSLIGALVSDGAVTVTAVAKGDATVMVSATDTEGLAATQEFAVTVPNRPPRAMGSIEERIFEIGDRATLELPRYFEDPDGDYLAYTLSSSDSALIAASIQGGTATVEALAKGTAVVTVTATDTEGLSATQEFASTVANRPPQVVARIEGQTVEVGETVALELPGYFEDPDGDALSYTVATLDTSVIAVSVSDGTMTVTALRKGGAAVTVLATDADGMTAVQDFTVTVPNRAPLAVGTISAMTVSKGGIKRLDPSPRFADPDGDTLVFEAESSRPSVARVWMASNGVVVRGLEGGAATVTITAKDSEGLDATQRFNLRVRGSDGSDPNRPPVAVGTIHSQNLDEGDTRTLNASSYFDDPDDDELRFSAESSDPEVVEASVSGDEVELEATGKGTATVTITARDPDELAATLDFTVTVSEHTGGNRSPVATGQIPEQNLRPGDVRTVNASSYFRDPDGDDLVFSAESSDAEVVNATTSGNQVELRVVAHGTAMVTVKAIDPDGLSAEQQFGVRVVEPSPDLVVGTPSTDDASLEKEATFTLLAMVINAGGEHSAATVLRYYLSTDATIGSSDWNVGTDGVRTLAAADSSKESISLSAPSTGGRYYYGACVDAVTGESNTSNNCSESLVITVEGPAPDLIVLGPNVSDSTPEAGGTFWLIGTVTNQGDGRSAATTVRYYRSTDATITTSDTEEGTDAVRALDRPQGYSATVRLTAPSTAGTYYYGACVDAVPGESDTTNNCSASVRVDVEESGQTSASVEVTAPQNGDPGGRPSPTPR